MPSGRAFTFRSSWPVAASVERVHELLVDLEHYPEWWPQVVAVAKIDDDTARLLCRSRLPYTLDLVLHAVHRRPDLLETDVAGDLAGSVRWRLTPVGSGTRIDFEQDVVVTGRWLASASYAASPLMRWNHAQMMAGCVRGLGERLRGEGVA